MSRFQGRNRHIQKNLNNPILPLVVDSGPSESCFRAEVLSPALRNKTFPEQGLRHCRLSGPSPLRPSTTTSSTKTSVWGILSSPCWGWKCMRCPPNKLGNAPHHIVTTIWGHSSEQWCANRSTSGPLFQSVVTQMSACFQSVCFLPAGSTTDA